jgi:hypothetical protein
MPIERFGLNSDVSPEGLVILENYGLAIYMAQLFERGLQNVLTGLERLGAITIPPDANRSGDGFVDDCLGPMLRVLKTQAKMDRETSRVLKKAHYQRNELVHRFLVENSVDMLDAAGRESINQQLRHIYSNIRRANWIVSQLAEKIFAQLGVTPDSVEKQIAELRRLSEDTGEDALDEDRNV